MIKIIGNGLIANAFKNTKESTKKDIILFCSGVSNSNEKLESEFKREQQLLENQLRENNNICFIYFSSILVSKPNTLYLKHKFNMEILVKRLSSNYIIIRLPQLAGNVYNTTLFPTFIENIYLNKNITIYTDSIRNIIDVDDVVRICFNIIDANDFNQTIDICACNDVSPADLAKIISTILNKEIYITFLDKSSIQLCDKSKIKKYLSINDILFDHSYTEKIVSKYIFNVINLIKAK